MVKKLKDLLTKSHIKKGKPIEISQKEEKEDKLLGKGER